jgi:C-terminal processing protease CtpA/Prc
MLGKTLTISAAASLVLAGCLDRLDSPSDDLDYGPADCTQKEQKKFVLRVMNDTYLWYREVPDTVPLENFDSPATLIEHLRYDVYDKWSVVVPQSLFDEIFLEGQMVGLGFSSQFDDAGNLIIEYVYRDSPAGRAGIGRGFQIISINGYSGDALGDEAVWEEVFGTERRAGVEVTMELQDPDGNLATHTLVTERVNINTVLHEEIYESARGRVGYFVLEQFIETSEAELFAVFSRFEQAGIDELVVDLRYNTGGIIDVAAVLASLIRGVNGQDEVFQKFVHNDRYRDWDFVERFEASASGLDLKRVVVLTTDYSCSASEALVSGLSPFMTVVTIGQRTCGKPVGMYAHPFCDQYILPIEFEGLNARDEGRYFDGIDVDCDAPDDFKSPFGRGEAMLEAALHYVENDSCASAMTAAPSLRTYNVTTRLSQGAHPLAGTRVKENRAVDVTGMIL